MAGRESSARLVFTDVFRWTEMIDQPSKHDDYYSNLLNVCIQFTFTRALRGSEEN